MDIHAGVYGRQSVRRANRSEVSTVTQRDAGVAEAKRRGAVSITEYEDLGISAFTGDGRPDFDRLLKDCHEGRINLIVVYYISRLSRMDPLDAIPSVTELLNLGVTIVSLTEGEFRKGNLMDLIHLILRLDAAHSESKNKSDAVRAAKKAASDLGGYVGGKPPYGLPHGPGDPHDARGQAGCDPDPGTRSRRGPRDPGHVGADQQAQGYAVSARRRTPTPGLPHRHLRPDDRRRRPDEGAAGRQEDEGQRLGSEDGQAHPPGPPHRAATRRPRCTSAGRTAS